MGRMLEWLTEHGKPLRVKVTTMDADLNELSIERDSLGQHLFDTVCKIIGLREIWYFGLCFTNRKGFTCWLQMDKRIKDQSVPKQEDGSLHFLFLVKFFPESVKVELIQDLTRHLFFLQIRQSILSMDLYCPSEAAILLASYAVQALYGDIGQQQQQQQPQQQQQADQQQQQQQQQLDLAKLLPVSVLQQYELTAEMWEQKIRNWWANNSGLSKEEAEEEFLCVAEELDMYGTQYYPIRNQKDAELLLGVSALGVGIFESDNKLSPRPFFPWTEIKCISFKNKMFTICTADKSKIKFRAQDMSINQSLLDLCVGTHNLYLRRRQPDLLEVQQMKQQADEQRRRRMEEQVRLHREREQRAQAEQERDRYRAELNHLSEQLSAMQNVIRSAEETQMLIAERARLSEQEAIEQARRASEAEAEAQRAKLSQLRAEETKMLLERKMRETEMAAQRMAALQHQQQQKQQQQNGITTPGTATVAQQQQQQQQMQQPPPYQEVVENRQQTQQQQMPLANGVGAAAVPLNRPTTAQSPKNNGGTTTPNNNNNNNLIVVTSPQQMAPLYFGGCQFEMATTMSDSRTSVAAELQHIFAELEMSRSEYNERNQSLRDRLANFRAELDSLKREGTDTENDRLFAQKVMAGDAFDKFSTLRKSIIGSPKSRVKLFDELTPMNGQ